MHKIRCSDEEKTNKNPVEAERELRNAPDGHLGRRLSSLLAELGGLGGAGLEAVLESSGNFLEVAAAAGANGPSPLGLLAPVVCKRNLVRCRFAQLG